MAAPTAASLFFTCFKIGSLSFGGGLSGWIHREFVERHGWIDDEDFAAQLALAQMLPGANVVNLVIGFGERLRGPVGALACLGGFLLTPFFAVIGLASVMDLLAHSRGVEVMLEGVAFAAIGMLVVMCGKGVMRSRRNAEALLVTAGAAVAVGILGWSMLPVVLVLAPVSVALAARRVRRDG